MTVLKRLRKEEEKELENTLEEETSYRYIFDDDDEKENCFTHFSRHYFIV